MRSNILIMLAIVMTTFFLGCPPANKPCDIDPSIVDQIDDGNEPPVFPYLADSPWPMTHRNPYCQASSPFPGPEEGNLCVNYLDNAAAAITLAISGPYLDERRVVWGNSIGSVFKMEPEGDIISYIDKFQKPGAPTSVFDPAVLRLDVSEGISGAYTLVDVDGTFFVPHLNEIIAYGDSVPGDPDSQIEIKRTYVIPETQRQNSDDNIVGLIMTYDGMLAFATSFGTVGVVSRDFSTAYYLNLGEDEEVSNSIAADEDNRIYVVTSKKMYGVKWTGSALTIDETSGGWSAGYEAGDDQSGIRLGKGSGSTPSLMGTGSQDKFVVVTDAQDLMHLVLFWRGEIPSDWVQISGTKDRRIAAQVPVTFGDPFATESLSEQSVCVRGYGAVVVNNELCRDAGGQILNILMSGVSINAPYGAEKFEWDPVARLLESAWVNQTVSLPNGIPSMSSTSNLLYDIGQRDSKWTLEALDWDTGESVFHHVIGPLPQYNSAYAATEIGHFGGLYTGTVLGVLRMMP